MLPILIVLGATGALLEFKRLVDRPPKEGDLFRLQKSEEHLKRVLQVRLLTRALLCQNNSAVGLELKRYICVQYSYSVRKGLCLNFMTEFFQGVRVASPSAKHHKHRISNNEILIIAITKLTSYLFTADPRGNLAACPLAFHSPHKTLLQSRQETKRKCNTGCGMQEVQRELQEERSEHEHDQAKISELESAGQSLRKAHADILARKEQEIRERALEYTQLTDKACGFYIWSLEQISSFIQSC